jgi:hypothetical protein
MSIKQKVLSTSATALIFLATFTSILTLSPPTVRAVDAIFTGNIYDYGIDTDADTLFNFLAIEVEVDVFVAGYYKITVDTLRDAYYNYLYLPSGNETYLDVGLQNVTLQFNGIVLYGRTFSPASITGVSITHEYETDYYSDYYYLSKTYDYLSFDTGATITGIVGDYGSDTNGDGLYNFLEVTVEVNVSDEALYQVYISGLINEPYYSYINVYNYTKKYLSTGAQSVTVSLYGATIYASHATNISRVSWIGLDICEAYQTYSLDNAGNLLLSKGYSFEEFETPAYFTGTILDEGIDNDSNVKFDYLQISIEVNITQVGDYRAEIKYLADNASNYIYVQEYAESFFYVDVYLVNLTIYGPTIYASHINITKIVAMNMYILNGASSLTVDSLQNVPLSKQYSYTDFESHAVLTGNISDRGVDTDDDSLYDYLEVGIEINVTEAGRYELYVSALSEKTDSGHETLGIYQSIEEYLNLGVQKVYLNISGPMLAYRHFSPTNVTDVSLYETEPPYLRLGYMPNAALSTKYDYTLFNGPLNDVEINFIVYPNGTVGVSGTSNFAHMYPENTGPLINATLNLATAGDTTTGSAVGTIIVPKTSSFEWPFNSSTADLNWNYQDGFLNANLDATVFMPPEGMTTYPTNTSDFWLKSSYTHTSNGLLDVELLGETQIPSHDSTFPFNISDIIVLANYDGNEISGNITFRTVSSFPLSDVMVFFNGNKTDMYFTGNLTVLYGSYFDMEINATTLEDMLSRINSTMPGQGEDSLYNMTDGMVECTQLETLKTPLYQDIEEIGAIIDYNVAIHGNFTGALAELLSEMFLGDLFGYPHEEIYQTVYASLESAFSSIQQASLQIIYYYTTGTALIDLHLTCDVTALWEKAMELVPPTVPTEYKTQVEAWLKIANATSHAIHEFSFNASYSKDTQRLNLAAWLKADAEQLKEDITPILPDAAPPELHEILESYFNTTYCTLTSSDATLHYANGIGNFEIHWTLQGDFKAQFNHAKRAYIDYLNATSPWSITWQYRMLNETEIDINNFHAEFKIGKDWMQLSFDGALAYPSKDEADLIRFKLFRFFNMTIDPEESPTEFEKIKITVTGGSNATHTVLLCAPSAVPAPNETSLDYKVMMWQNTSFSSLKELLYQIAYQGRAEYAGTTYYVPIFTNSTVSDFSFDHDEKSISFNVSGTAGTGFCNITVPRALIYASPTEWVVILGDRILAQEEYNVTENAEYVFIYLNYSHSSHLIEIKGMWVVTEYQPNLLPLTVVALSLIAVLIALMQRKRLGTLKTRCQNVTRAFANKLLHSKT